MSHGTVFNIQKYSLHNGPGIRTTVFLKGCPLSCWWCHNPESRGMDSEILFIEDKCIACGDCERVCPSEAIKLTHKGIKLDKAKCILCGKCSESCPSEALEKIGRKMRAEEVMDEVKKDRVFYEESGGGVTFSGGEPLIQINFLENLLTLSKQMGIHTVVDTSGYSSWENIDRIKGNVDIFLYDIKHMDNEKHKKYIGIPNVLILENLKRLVRSGSRIWVRIPLIPGINDDFFNIARTCEYISSLRLKDLYILPYHNIAKEKYKRLGMKYKIPDAYSLEDKELREISKLFKNYGLNVKIGG